MDKVRIYNNTYTLAHETPEKVNELLSSAVYQRDLAIEQIATIQGFMAREVAVFPDATDESPTGLENNVAKLYTPEPTQVPKPEVRGGSLRH